MNLDCWRLVDAQHLICVEIALLDAAVLQRDLAVESCGHAKHHTALDPRLHRGGIDHRTAIRRADDAMDTHGAILCDLDFGDLREIAPEYILQDDAAATSF